MTNTTEAALRDALKDIAKGVFIDAATQTHYSWIDGTNGREPDFGEAASDYAESFADAYVEQIAALSQPSPASSTAKAEVEKIARAMEPALWSDDEETAHMAASPLQVCYARERALIVAEQFLVEYRALSPSSGEPASVAGEVEPVAWMYEKSSGCHLYHNRQQRLVERGYAETALGSLSKPTPVEAGLREALTRLGAPVRIDAFNHIAAGEENYNAMLLSDEDPGCARILAQNMQDQTADDIAFVINAAFNRLQSPSHPVADKRGPYTGSMLSGCMEFSERPQASPPPVQGEVTPYKVETVTGDFMQEPGEPFWRIEIGGYCADFDHEQGAINFAAAINRLAHSQTETQEGEIASLKVRLAQAEKVLGDVPIPNRTEAMLGFFRRMDEWLKGPYRAFQKQEPQL